MRAKSTRRPPVLTHLSDGSYLSDLHGLPVRILDAELTVTVPTAAGSATATG